MLAKPLLLLLAVATGPEPQRFEVLHTTIDLAAPGSALTNVVPSGRRPAGQVYEFWRAELDAVKLEIVLRVMPRSEYEDLDAPSDIVEVTEWNRANDDRAAKKAAIFSFDEHRAVPGAFGWISYGWLGVKTLHLDTKPIGTFLDFAVLTRDHGWELEIDAEPALDAAQLERLVETLRLAITYDGPKMEPNWTDEEVEERWRADAPKKVQEDQDLFVVRTEHYLIMTVLKKGTAGEFGKKMDENYERIRSIFPFDDVPGQRLLPIYYFQSDDEYFDFLVGKIGWSREQAERSGGVASGDWYATYHQAINAPVHIHEATHQIFDNRLMLGGGGSWYQEGVAEYMSSNENDLNELKRLAKDDEHTPFQKFFVVPSLLMSNEGERVSGESNAGLAYAQAAAIIEYVRHSKETRARFLPWIHAVGRTARGDLPSLERATVQTLGFDLAELESRWKAYYIVRKKVRDWHWPAKKMVK